MTYSNAAIIERFKRKFKRYFKMITLTIELPEEETPFFKEFLSKIHGKIISEDRVPNKETIRAMKELKSGKGVKFNNVDELFKSI
jgi:hypothetical protein